MQFPLQDLTEKYISSSYQDVMQVYKIGGKTYFLDGIGNLIDICNITASHATTAISSVIYYGNLDGGTPDYFYGGVFPLDVGSP